MARQSREERHKSIHYEALQAFDDIQTSMKDERLQCLADRRFYSIAGAQWEGSLTEQFENKPRLEVNKVHLSVMRIINEYRNNRITVDYLPKDGTTDDDLADTCDRLYRADEEDSGAEEAYDNAFEEAVGGGFGAWRLRATDEDDTDPENERQRIHFEPIYDADSSVFFDLGAKRQDKSDAKYCYVLYSMTPKEYESLYGVDMSSVTKEIEQTQFDWNTPDVVYVCEYYRVEEVSERIRIYQTLDGEEIKHTEADFEADETLELSLAAQGATMVRERRIKRRKVRRYLLSGERVLEDFGYVAGSEIPIVPVYGKRWFVDNVERCMGHVRLAKDMQRLKNMQLSKLGELAASGSNEKPIFTTEQVAGLETYWAQDNVKNYAYLPINPVTNMDGQEQAMGPVGYTKPPTIPQAMAALIELSDRDMKEVLGSAEAGEEIQPQMSGRAVELIQNRLDMQTYIYMSNMSKAVKRCGEIWLRMARDIYVEKGRKMKGVGAGGEVGSIELGRERFTPEGELIAENDLSRALFDVRVAVGPTSSSRRAATVRALTGMMTLTQDLETLQVLGAMTMMNMEGEGIADVREFFRKRLLRLGVVKPTEEEMQSMQAELQAQQPTPNDQLAGALAAEAQAKAVKAQADTELSLAKAEQTRAQAAKTLADMDIDERDGVLRTAKDLQEITAAGGQVPGNLAPLASPEGAM